jgi:Protein of unknown function (DUF3150)
MDKVFVPTANGDGNIMSNLEIATTTDTQENSLQNAYSKLFASGVLMQVHVSKWSMESKLEFKDLGLPVEIPQELFKSGKKLLMPEEEKNKFIRLEGKARRILESHAFQFPIAQAHFVPSNKIITVMQELDVVRVEFNKMVDVFIENYEALKTATLDKYPQYRGVLEPHYPSVSAVKSKFGFSVSNFQIDFPKELKETSFQELLIQQGAKAEVVAEYKKQMEASYNEALGTMHTFVNDAVSTLRTEAAKACTFVRNKIANGEPVTKTNLTTITEMITNFETMNFFNDSSVSTQLAQLKRLVTSEGDFRNDTDAIQSLSQALQAVTTAATTDVDVSDLTTTYFRAIEV